MLSRVADSLYWMSRYLERAEHTTRLLDVNLNLMLDESSTSADRRWLRLLQALGKPKRLKWEGNPYELARTLTFDSGNKSSVVYCIIAARENARHVREQISTEQWHRLNSLYLSVTRPEFKKALALEAASESSEAPAAFLQEVMEAVHQFQGVTDSTMSHGEGWQFIQVGRFWSGPPRPRCCWRPTMRTCGPTPTAPPRATSIWSGWACCAARPRSRPTARSTPLT
jgi:uncharacterized alpha-E superfamily protein